VSGHPDGLVTFEAGAVKYTAVFGFKAMKAVEAHYDKPFFRAIQAAMPAITPEDAGDKAKIAEASANIKFSDIGALFGFALLRHHPQLNETEVEDLIDEIGLEKASEVIGQALTSALVKEGDDGSSPHPPEAARAK
jgi:hypothetical protein